MSDQSLPISLPVPVQAAPQGETRAKFQVSAATGFFFLNALFVFSALTLSLIAAWPVYQSYWLLITAGSGMLAGVVAVLLVRRLKGSLWHLCGLLLLLFLLLVPFVAYPGVYQEFGNLPALWLDAAQSSLSGWKELITISLPVGHYGGLLVPVFVLFLFGSALALFAAVKHPRGFSAAVPVLAVVQLFGAAFGFAEGTGRLSIGTVTIPALRELILSVFWFFAVLLWLQWRTALGRKAALLGHDTGAEFAIKPARVSRSLLQGFTVALMLSGALTAGAVMSPALLENQPRDVLRSAVDPRIEISAQPSPLSDYRRYQNDDYARHILTIQSAETLPERLRVAVMEHYDGERFHVLNLRDQTAASGYARLPSGVNWEVPGAPQLFEVELQGTSSIWIPLTGLLENVNFSGNEQLSALRDSFFYRQTVNAAINTALPSLAALTLKYQFTSLAEPLPETGIAELLPVSLTSLNDEELVPPSLRTWIDSQRLSGRDGSVLQQLIDRLRARGYLSHSLDQMSGEELYPWVQALPNYTFEPSFSGHSVERIDLLFSQLNLKHAQLIAELPAGQESAAGAESNNAQLVAAVGDDEQFAAAAALLARELGFESRVVLGFYLQESTEDSRYRIPACEAGECSGANAAAWIEVRGQGSTWIPVDVTPQLNNPLSLDNITPREPELPTELEEQKPVVLPPRQNDPASGEEVTGRNDEGEGGELWFLAVLKEIGFFSLIGLMLATPFLTVIIAKRIRRRQRKLRGSPEEQIAGAWRELIDDQIDSQTILNAKNHTRQEMAGQSGLTRFAELASLADEAVFGAKLPDDELSAKYWELTERSLTETNRERSLWRRMRTLLSVRSFFHGLSETPVEVQAEQAPAEEVLGLSDESFFGVRVGGKLLSVQESQLSPAALAASTGLLESPQSVQGAHIASSRNKRKGRRRA